LTLNKKLPEVPPGSLLIVRPYDRKSLAGKGDGGEETLVLYDILGAREDDLVGLVEGREAAVPFHPRKAPLDCYNACILDDINFQPILEVQ